MRSDPNKVKCWREMKYDWTLYDKPLRLSKKWQWPIWAPAQHFVRNSIPDVEIKVYYYCFVLFRGAFCSRFAKSHALKWTVLRNCHVFSVHSIQHRKKKRKMNEKKKKNWDDRYSVDWNIPFECPSVPIYI